MKYTKHLASLAAIGALPLATVGATPIDTRQPSTMVKAAEETTLTASEANVDPNPGAVHTRKPHTLTPDLTADDSTAFAVSNPEASVADQLAHSSKLSTLAKAIEAADLESALNGDGPFTIFAPTNEAFEALPEGTLDHLLKPENKQQLRTILLAHVVEGKVQSEQLTVSSVETMAGNSWPVTTRGDRVTIGGGDVVHADLVGGNGVIHVIDTVNIPE